MGKQSSLFLGANIAHGKIDFTTATTTDLISAASNDSLVKSIIVRSTDTAAQVLHLLLHDGSAAYSFAAVSIPAAAGNDGTTASVDLLASNLLPGLPVDNVGKRYIPLKTGYKLQCTLDAINSTKHIIVVAFGEDF